jgi:hypothetical protein
MILRIGGHTCSKSHIVVHGQLLGPAAQSRLGCLGHFAAGGATLHCLRANAGVLFARLSA